MEGIVRCQTPDVAALAAMLARAFLHDPLYGYTFTDPATRDSLLAWEMGGLVRYGLRFGEVFATATLAGCAVWLPPGETDFTEERMAQVDMLDAAPYIGQDAERRLSSFVTASEEYHRRIVPGAHWYLVVLGVEPGRQAQGVGGALLASTLRRVDEGKYPVYLETTNPANIPFYAGHGFAVRVEAPLPDDGVAVWYMVRDPLP